MRPPRQSLSAATIPNHASRKIRTFVVNKLKNEASDERPAHISCHLAHIQRRNIFRHDMRRQPAAYLRGNFARQYALYASRKHRQQLSVSHSGASRRRRAIEPRSYAQPHPHGIITFDGSTCRHATPCAHHASRRMPETATPYRTGIRQSFQFATRYNCPFI